MARLSRGLERRCRVPTLSQPGVVVEVLARGVVVGALVLSRATTHRVGYIYIIIMGVDISCEDPLFVAVRTLISRATTTIRLKNESMHREDMGWLVYVLLVELWKNPMYFHISTSSTRGDSVNGK